MADDSSAQIHRRTPSSRSTARPRRSTRGPLDIADTPIAGPLVTPRVASPAHSIQSQRSPSRPQIRSPQPASVSAPPKDFSYLLRPELYHPLPTLDLPTPFRNSSKQPSPTTLLSTLLATGHFRASAIKAASTLISPTEPISPYDHQQIFSLFYTRLACLTLCNATTLATQEVKALEDLSSSYYLDSVTGNHLVPWELRVLAVRLQSVGFNDIRKGVMGYYDLARDARSQLTKLKAANPGNEDVIKEKQLWERRLYDLGIRVANALVEVEDFEGAARHLGTLKGLPSFSQFADDASSLTLAKALLWLRIGNVDAARACVAQNSDESNDADVATSHTSLTIAALTALADGDYATAAENFRALSSQEGSSDPMYSTNLAVCLLYMGKMDEARSILENLVDERQQSFHALTFNLCTVYELCTERSQALKMGLAGRLAGLEDRGVVGWEKDNVDLKL